MISVSDAFANEIRANMLSLFGSLNGEYTTELKLITYSESEYGEDPSSSVSTKTLNCFLRHPGRTLDSAFEYLPLSIGQETEVDYKLMFPKEYLDSEGLVNVDGSINITEHDDEVELYGERYEILGVHQGGMLKGDHTVVSIFVKKKV